MSALVCIDTRDGAMTRFLAAGSKLRKTHFAVPKNGIEQLTHKIIENFRFWPDPEFSVEPPPRPTSPPAASGQIAMAA